MRRSRIVSPMHFVWTTHERMPLLTGEVRRSVHRCLTAKAEELGCEVLALGGMPDHIHIAVMFPATVTYSRFIHLLKGASSHLVKEATETPDAFFYWQEGYGAFGYSRSHIGH